MTPHFPADPDDETLWRAFRGGNERAFAQLYRRYVGVLYNYGYHFAPNPDLVRDAIQELFVDLWRWRNTLSETSSVKYYLFRALRRRIREATDADRRTDALAESDEADPALASPSPEAEHLAREQETLDLARLHRHLLDLPPRQQEAIRLRFFDEFSWGEIAGIMQMNEQSVRNLVQRGVQKLQRLFGLLSLLWWVVKS